MTDASRVRPSGLRRRPGPWLLAGLLLAAASLPGGLAAAHVVRVAPEVGVARPLASNPSFSVSLTDAPAFVPRFLNATVSGPVNVSVHLSNTGAIAHTFTVANQSGVVLNRSWTPQQLDAYFSTNGWLATKNVSAGGSAWANFTLAASSTFRSFEFVSTIPYQFQAGMWGFLNLTPIGPSVVVNESATASFQFIPNVLSAGPSVHGPVSLHVNVTNIGGDSHTFTVSSQANVTLTSLANLSTFTPLANVPIPSGAPGFAWANFTVPAVGVYEYVCTISGHFAAGMYGFLYVGVPVPAPPPSPSSAIVEVPVLLGSALLLGVGLVLALVTAYAGRFPKEPAPPEHGS
ncbi:MAG TPA: hypothetical protein VEH10_00685 [Thermoplasmata archaeon]|nr:hypothetical protein [Thermoplasmata archaeon]